MTHKTFATIADAVEAVRQATNESYPYPAAEFLDGTVLQITEPACFVGIAGGELFANKSEYGLPVAAPGTALSRAIGAAEHHATYEITLRTKQQRIDEVKRRIAEAIGTRASLNPGLHVDGKAVYSLDYRWQRMNRDNLSIIVRTGRKTTRFPQRKDGTHNYAEIARLLLASADRDRATREAEARRKANAETVSQEALAELNKQLSYGVSISADPEKPLSVRYDIRRNMTVEQARELIAAMQRIFK